MRMTKLWLDVETTGLDSEKNGIIQIACIVEDSSGKVLDTFEIKVKPFKGCIYDKKALEINGKTREDIYKYPTEKQAMSSFVNFLNMYQKNEIQYSLSGYNSQFDQNFIIAIFKRHRQYNFWKYFNYKDIDVFALIKILDLWGSDNSQKLGSMCDKFGIKLTPHDALEDIKATRKLYKKIIKRHIK